MSQETFDLGDVPAEPTFSVGELTTQVSDALRRAFPEQVWVRGEVQNLKRYSSGHTYFSLVEKGTGTGDKMRARLECVLFRDDRPAVNRALKQVPGAELGNDVEVRIRGRVSVYQGKLQLVMSAIDPVFTVGGIAANRDKVLRALAADGVLDANPRLPMPLVPLRVGLVTSEGSAAYHDFVHELEASGFAFRVAVLDVRVQGAAASRRIVWALRQLAARAFDVVVLARGGGSRADLAPFDTELVARAIAAMPIPVLTGVGHEVDRSVADEVAHTACKTPTACAQTLVQRVRAFVDDLDDAAHRVSSLARSRAAIASHQLDDAARRVQRDAPSALARQRTRVDRAHGRAQELARRRARDASRDLDDCTRRLGDLGRRGVATAGRRLDAAERAVRALDPRRVLERGYTITRAADGRVVRRVAEVAVGGELVTELPAGRITSRVEAAEDDA
ncbi:MAG TPA: exodeoxyribonuclease VII large subunit [Acidimicrobiia bacterium]|nr:exodeoxyribonuclease VII large subunit [Acidimicrobiia bacterium]